jgi:hypothetical protein
MIWIKKRVADTQPIIDGLMDSTVNALNKLPWLPSFFIMLLFLAIEPPLLLQFYLQRGI